MNYIENVTGITFLGVCDNEMWLILSSFYAKGRGGFVAQAWRFPAGSVVNQPRAPFVLSLIWPPSRYSEPSSLQWLSRERQLQLSPRKMGPHFIATPTTSLSYFWVSWPGEGAGQSVGWIVTSRNVCLFPSPLPSHWAVGTGVEMNSKTQLPVLGVWEPGRGEAQRKKCLHRHLIIIIKRPLEAH